MADIRCALLVSSMEGWRSYALPPDYAPVTLEGIDVRVRRLEQSFGIQSPAPMLEETWASITYRLSRLQRRNGPRGVLEKRPHGEFLPEDKAEALAQLKNMASKVRCAEASAAWPEEGGKDKTPLLLAIAQQLCHAAGRFGYKPQTTDLDVANLYSFAVELMIESESRPGPPGIRPGIPGMRPPGAPRPMPPSVIAPKKSCCGCCNCHCHKDKKKTGFWSRNRSGHRRKWRFLPGFGWMRNLWCFGKKNNYYSDTSSSGSDSDTIIDD